MRILVYPHDLGVGGSQLNALDLAAAVRARGHEVLVHGTPGPLVDRVHELGLEFVEAAPIGRRPSPAAVAGLVRLSRGARTSTSCTATSGHPGSRRTSRRFARPRRP